MPAIGEPAPQSDPARLKDAASLGSLVRSDNWLGCKIPPLLAVGYAMMLQGEVGAVSGTRTLLLLLVSIFSVAAYGHLINDIFDIREDLANGKRNTAARLSPLQRAACSLLLVASGFAPLALLQAGPVPAALLLVNYLLPTVYSIPPLRLKERGLAGVLADALGAHAVPTLFIACTWGGVHGGSGGRVPLLAAAATAWAFFAGLRGIIIHQVGDRFDDRRAGVVTFIASRRRKDLLRLVRRRLYPCELAGILAFVGLLLPDSGVLLALSALYVVGEYAKIRLDWKLPLFYPERPALESYWPLVNNEFYEVWLPLGLALQLGARGFDFAVLPLLHILLFRRGVQERLTIGARLAANVFDQIRIRMS